MSYRTTMALALVLALIALSAALLACGAPMGAPPPGDPGSVGGQGYDPGEPDSSEGSGSTSTCCLGALAPLALGVGAVAAGRTRRAA